MMARVQNWWMGLSLRERWMVGTAAALAVLVLIWLTARMFMTLLDTQAEQHREAVARAARVETKAALVAALPADDRALPAGPIDQWLAQSAAETGLRLDRNEARGERMASIAIASARAQGVVAWLAWLEDRGLVFDRLTVTPAPDGSVAVVAEVRRP